MPGHERSDSMILLGNIVDAVRRNDSMPANRLAAGQKVSRSGALRRDRQPSAATRCDVR